MGFTIDYLKLCWIGRELWTGKSTQEGDWYLVGDNLDLRVVGRAELDAISFAESNIAYVPDTDDLLEIIDNQIEVSGSDPEKKSLGIEFSPDGGWSLRVEYGRAETVSERQPSIHMVLLMALTQMVQHLT